MGLYILIRWIHNNKTFGIKENVWELADKCPHAHCKNTPEHYVRPNKYTQSLTKLQQTPNSVHFLQPKKNNKPESIQPNSK